MIETTHRQCPYCAETVAARATRCRHCRSPLLPRGPAHDGVCPFCREEIRPGALVCRHCDANVAVLIDASPLLGLPGLPALGRRGGSVQRAGSQPTGGGGGGGDGGGTEQPPRFCVTIPVPDCHIEPGKPVDSKDGAGYEPDQIVCDGWRLVTLCLSDIL